MIKKELDEFVNKIHAFAAQNCPSWLTPNSNFVGIRPGHNLDLLEISSDFLIDRYQILNSEIPQELKDPSKLEIVK